MLQKAQKNQDEAVRAAIQKERATSNEKHEKQEKDLRAALEKRTAEAEHWNRQNRDEIERLQRELKDFRIEKEKELTAAKMTFEVQSQKADELKKTLEENAALRSRLEILEKKIGKGNEESSRLQQLMEENAKLKKDLESLSNSDESVRRTARFRMPSEKLLENMSTNALEQLKIKIEKMLQVDRAK